METVAEHTATPRPAPRKAPGIGSRLLALVGELMIIVGALLGLYVVWQLFYTDIEANSVQEQTVAVAPVGLYAAHHGGHRCER